VLRSMKVKVSAGIGGAVKEEANSNDRASTPMQVNNKEALPRSRSWWLEDSDLFREVRSAKDFDRAMAEAASQSPPKVMVVDYYARWCSGCRELHPVLCQLARDNPEFMWVRVSGDANHALMRRQGVSGFPHVQVYNDHDKLVDMDAPPKAHQQLVETIGAIHDRLKELERVPRSSQASPPEETYTEMTEDVVDDYNLESDEVSSPEVASAVAPSPPPTAAVPAAPLDSLASKKAAFLAKYSDMYGYGGHLDEIYELEVGQRMGKDQHYLDYCGASVYTNSQLKATFAELEKNLFGNPHSANPSSELTGDQIDEVRDQVLAFFNAPPGEYHVIFTRGATASLKLVGETFPWTEESEFVYLRENHNSVLGIREYAHVHNSHFQSISEDKVNQWLDTEETVDESDPSLGASDAESDKEDSWSWDTEDEMDYTEEGPFSLFAYPAEENYAGQKMPLEWIERVKAKTKAYKGGQKTNWKVLVDAAAYVASQPLDLSEFPADFVTISFYKMFGYPTGLGALIMRTENIEVLNKVFWGGGSVKIASSDSDFHILQCQPSSKLEDGTVPFLDIVALKHGFRMYEKLGGVEAVQRHVRALTEYAYDTMSSLRHSNGAPMLKIYGKHHMPNRHEVQGGVVNFTVLRANADPLGYVQVQLESAAAGFHIRTGTSCNPGAAYSSLHLRNDEIEQLAEYKESCGDDNEWIFVQRGGSTASWDQNDKKMQVDADQCETEPHPIVVSGNEDMQATLKELAATKIQLGHEGEIALHWEQVPLGSVRMSLGWMSTFEDVQKFVDFLEQSYKDV